MSDMKILSIDPGKTSGVVLLKFSPALAEGEQRIFATPDPPAPIAWALVTGSFVSCTIKLEDILHLCDPHHVVVEDYRMYAGKEAMHTGRRLWTAELIGAIRALVALQEESPKLHVVQAQIKNRWGNKRLLRFYPLMFKLKPSKNAGVRASLHTLDAFKLGLAWLESEGVWTPELPR